MIDRHSKDCLRNFRVIGCACGVKENDPHWLKRKLDILARMEVALGKCKHYQSFSKRILPFFKEALPERIVNIGHSGSHHRMLIWDKLISYDDAIWITLWTLGKETDGMNWSELFRFHLDRYVNQIHTSLRQMKQEDICEGQLSNLARKQEELIEEARKIAPSPSFDLIRMFPSLFGNSGSLF